MSKPIELSNFIWNDTYSPLQHDYKALAFIELDSTHYRFAFPLSSYYSVSVENENGLQLFDLYHDASGTVLNKQGVIQAPAYQGIYRDRAIIHDDSVFYIHGNYVWSAPWSLEYVISEP